MAYTETGAEADDATRTVPIAPAELTLDQRRAAVQAEAERLGMRVVDPHVRPAYRPVEVRLRGEEDDVADALDMLVRRGVRLTNPSEMTKVGSSGRIDRWVTVRMDDVANDPSAPPPNRALWEPAYDSVEWEGVLLRFVSEEEQQRRRPDDRERGIVAPYDWTPKAGSLPVPLLDRQGRQIGEVRRAEVRRAETGEVLLLAGVVAESQVRAVMESPRLGSHVRVKAVNPKTNDGLHRMVSPWSLPAVCLCTDGNGVIQLRQPGRRP
ncbi:hypothetical protein F5972_08590 [Microbispora cellulosiformans]|uniref:Uncharacterized protein n=1 Tax=Microbispora cellulosiformans TaxID=2614688 RepID=A0A5J5K7C7_9ACTN|nr:hypothetical protein [Microbispora cellulosiformans]KAA9379698.1 hypothetical protein F5972_08590 [Microbispora cellulosiformans]